MHNIKYSKQAELDLFEVIAYIAKESKTNALHYLNRYEEKIELLKQNPLMGADCKNKLIKRDCRVLVHESHIIIYQINQEKNVIFIVRIFHGSENYQEKI